MSPRASLSAQTITVGDPVDYVVTLNSRVDPPRVPKKSIDRRFEPLTVLSHELEAVSTGNAGADLWVWRVSLTHYKVETVTIPTQSIRVKQGKRFKRERIPAKELKIKTVLQSQSQPPADLKPPMTTAREWSSLVGIVGGVIALGFLGLFLRRLLKKRPKKRPENESEVTAVKPGEWALAECERLAHKQLIQDLRIKDHYLGCSHILKGYLSAKLEGDFIEATSAEIVTAIEAKELDLETVKRIRKALHLYDQVKYAKFQPIDDENREALPQLRALITRMEDQA